MLATDTIAVRGLPYRMRLWVCVAIPIAPNCHVELTDVDSVQRSGECGFPYGQLTLEQAAILRVDKSSVDTIFAVLIRDFSQHPVQLHVKPAATDDEREWFSARYGRRSTTPAASTGCALLTLGLSGIAYATTLGRITT